MATAGFTDISDVIKPRIFDPYVSQAIYEKSELVQSGAMVRVPDMDRKLAGGGATFDVPSWQPITNEEENYSSDADSSAAPKNANTSQEVQARLERNQSWGAYDLTATLAGSDPLEHLGNQIAGYWALRLQAMVIAMVSGINKDNGVNDSGDYASDIVGASYSAGVTDFSASALIDAIQTLGDAKSRLTNGIMLCHSVVHAKLDKNDLITFQRESDGRTVQTYRGMQLLVDDGMPSGTSAVRGAGTAGVAGVYETWLFAPGALGFGLGSAKVPSEVSRDPAQGDGGGRETIHSRQVWCAHLPGHAYTGTAPDSGPTNAATTNNLNIATSWNRVYPSRKQIPYVRLVTREHA